MIKSFNQEQAKEEELFLLPVTKNGPNNQIEYLKHSIAL
jgi:hypothetical protein